MAHYRMKLEALVPAEIDQRREEGCDVEALKEKFERLGDQRTQSDLEVLFDELQALKPRDDFPYEEPSELASVQAVRPEGPRRLSSSKDTTLTPEIPFQGSNESTRSISRQRTTAPRPRRSSGR